MIHLQDHQEEPQFGNSCPTQERACMLGSGSSQTLLSLQTALVINTLEKQAGKMQSGTSINRTATAQNTSAVCEIGIKYRVDFTSHDNWADSQQDSFQLCPRLSSRLSKGPGIISMVLLIWEVSYNNANVVLKNHGWIERILRPRTRLSNA